jgi:hypothetical protein
MELGSTVSAQSSAISSIQTEMSNIVAVRILTAITDPGDLLAYRWLASGQAIRTIE